MVYYFLQYWQFWDKGKYLDDIGVVAAKLPVLHLPWQRAHGSEHVQPPDDCSSRDTQINPSDTLCGVVCLILCGFVVHLGYNWARISFSSLRGSLSWGNYIFHHHTLDSESLIFFHFTVCVRPPQCFSLSWFPFWGQEQVDEPKHVVFCSFSLNIWSWFDL